MDQPYGKYSSRGSRMSCNKVLIRKKVTSIESFIARLEGSVDPSVLLRFTGSMGVTGVLFSCLKSFVRL